MTATPSPSGTQETAMITWDFLLVLQWTKPGRYGIRRERGGQASLPPDFTDRDGFLAYLIGREIAPEGCPGAPEVLSFIMEPA